MNNFFQTIENFGDRILAVMTPMRILLFSNMLFVLTLIILSNLQVLPLRFWDFIFFSLLFFLLALYRSGWVFAVLVGMSPLENINLAPMEFGINLRPYQFLAVLLALAVFIRLLTGRIKWPLFRISWLDGVMGGFLLLGFLLIPFLPFPELTSVALKQSVILLSFGLLYILGRIFLKKESDVRIAIAFFFSSIAVVLGYGLWQALRFKWNLPDFSVMPGRPNGTFPEADFFGGVLAMIISGMIPFGLSFFFWNECSRLKKMLFAILLFLVSLILILTVARSGWLAAATGMIVSAALFFWRNGIFEALREWDGHTLRKDVFAKFFIGLPIALALGTIFIFQLTSFDLLDRGKSFSSGLQEITVSCEVAATVPEKIVYVEELKQYGCRHINLDEIESELASGRAVKEVFRDDPNISIRKTLYRESWSLIREYPLTGLGWGNASHFFGVDGRGSGMNASNVFLQVWLEAGVIAFLGFLCFWFSFLILLLRDIIQGSDRRQALLAMSLIASWIAITVFNLFNSGLLLGSLWIFFSILVWFVNSFNSKRSS